jgi:hypothetical protein
MGRKILAVLVGMIAGFAVIGLVEGLSNTLFPVPAGVDTTDMEALKRHVMTLPASAMLLVLAAHALGALAAGYACARIARAHWPTGSWIVGGLLLCAGVANLLLLPHPAWFAVADVLLYLPLAHLGGRLGAPKAGAAPAIA